MQRFVELRTDSGFSSTSETRYRVTDKNDDRLSVDEQLSRVGGRFQGSQGFGVQSQIVMTNI